MRKIVLTLGFLFCILCTQVAANAATLGQAIASGGNFIMLIYTSWANYSDIYYNMKNLQPSHQEYQFVKVNLDDPDAANLFLERRFIVSDIPMVIVAKKGGRINKVVSNRCAADSGCLAKELKRFARQ